MRATRHLDFGDFDLRFARSKEFATCTDEKTDGTAKRPRRLPGPPPEFLRAGSVSRYALRVTATRLCCRGKPTKLAVASRGKRRLSQLPASPRRARHPPEK